MVYVDRTAYLREVERLGRVLVFLRRAGDFEDLFGGLAVGGEPTPLRNRYFVLQWNFSEVDASGSAEQIGESLRRHVGARTNALIADYMKHLPEPIAVDGEAVSVILDSLLSAVRQTPYKLYLLIDEYDNFVNEVMAKDTETYRPLFDTDGPFKQVFKSVKAAFEGRGLERIFVTGVSPVALNDLTSGFNIAKDVSLTPELAGLCGFRETEIRDLLELVARERDLPTEVAEGLVEAMRTWYNGYRFNQGTEELVYNPTNVLYFLDHVYRRGSPPEELYDQNLRTDRGKLAFLARSAAGAGVIEQLTEGNAGEVAISRLETSFSLDNLTARLGTDRRAIASFLYYMGLLTLSDDPFRLRIPNLVVRKLFLDRLLEIYLPEPGDSSEAQAIATAVFRGGDLGPLLAFFEERLLPVLSNRDRGAAPRRPGPGGTGVNEMVVKTLFLSILFDDHHYRISSEPEIERAYADLCLLVRDEMRCYGYFDLLFEFKLVRRKELGREGQEIRGLSEADLHRLPAVAAAFAQARDQIEHYRAALIRRHGSSALNLRCYAVVAVGLERVLGEEVGNV